MGLRTWFANLGTVPKEIRHLERMLRQEIMIECRSRVRTKPRLRENLEILASELGCGGSIFLLVIGVFLWGYVIGILIAILPFAFFMSFIAILDCRTNAEPDMRTALKKVLDERNIRPGFCFDCGYNLKHMESHLCPECGAELPAGETNTTDEPHNGETS